jgi:hypothetical protein
MPIATLAYKIVADTKDLTGGMALTKRELTASKKIMEELKSPADKLAQSMAGLDVLFKKGALSAGQHTAAIAKVKAEYSAATKEVAQVAPQGIFGAMFKSGLALRAVDEGVSLVKSGLRAVVSNVKQQFAELDDISDLSQRLGIAPEQLVGLQLVAERADVETGALTGGLEKMSKFIGRAQLGDESGKKLLGDMGLNADTLALKPVEEQFTLIAGAISQAKTQTEQMALATKIFGLSGADIIPMLGLTREELAGVTKEAQALGLAFTAEQLSSIDAADESIKRLSASWKALGRTIAVEVAPAVSTVEALVTADTSDMSTWEKVKSWASMGSIIGASSKLSATLEDTARMEAETRQIAKRTEEKRKKRDLADTMAGIGETGSYAAEFEAAMAETSLAQDMRTQTTGYANEFQAAMNEASNALGIRIKKTKTEADALTRRYESPADSAAREFRDIQRLRDEGAISEELYGRAGMDLTAKAFGGRETGANTAIAKGSAEYIRLQEGQKGKSREITLAEQQLVQLKKIADKFGPEKIEEVSIL